MSRPKKRQVALTDGNFADYFPWDYPESLVDGLTICEGSLDRADPIVTEFLVWLANQNAQSPDLEYTCTRHDAAVILELAAGWHGEYISGRTDG